MHLSKKPGKKALTAPITLFVTIKLIRLGKQRVKVPVNAVQSIHLKHMCQSSLNSLNIKIGR